METKHTPGPWILKYVAHSKRGAVRIVDKATHGRICEVQAARQDMEGAPNARLIAAAPELLEALQEIVAAADGEGWSQLDAGFTKARAAVAKALGND